MEEETIVDVDVHLDIFQFPDRFADYVDSPWDDYIRNTKYNPMTVDGWSRSMGGKIQPAIVEDAEQLYEDLCEGFNVDYPIINSFAYLPNFPDPEMAQAVSRGVNDMLLDEYLDEYDNFKGLVGVDVREPEKAAEEIHRIGSEDDIVGVCIENGAENRMLGDPIYDVIYKAAEDNNLPVAFHSGAGSIFMQGFPNQHTGFRKFLSEHVVSHPFAMMQTMTSLIVQGTPVKFPDLDFIFLEAGIEWVPSVMYRLNKEYSMRRVEAPLLEKSPEEHIRDSCYIGTQPMGEPNDPTDIQKLIKILGPEMIMFATDYPHWDFDEPNGVDKHLRTNFTAEERDALLKKNAVDVFEMEI